MTKAKTAKEKQVKRKNDALWQLHAAAVAINITNTAVEWIAAGRKFDRALARYVRIVREGK